MRSPTRTQSQDDADVTFAQLLGNLEIKYKMATDDLQFATETQGSIYFLHDFQGAQASLETCRLAYQQLLAHVRQQDIAQWIHGQWAPILQQMDDIMDMLAATASATNDASSLSSYSTTAYLA
ncbi:hypothetical protein BC940DRAFT_365185 [Gongronella butleri]|nr:hypothetical protein BC940DRAFT_365185 [Gongronella butleri]